MDYRPNYYSNRNAVDKSNRYKKKRIFWLNSSFNSDFVLIDNKIYEISFDIPPFEIFKNNRLKLLTYIRDSHQSKPIQIKLKLPLTQSRDIINTDKEAFPIIYTNHSAVEAMTYGSNPIIRLIPQQITRFTFRLDDNYSQLDYNSYFTSITNGSVFQVAGGSPDDKYIIFNSSGSFVLDKNLNCDILVVGGGGGGGFFGAGGGAGQVLYTTNLNLNLGTYTITVGSGGAGSSTSSTNGSNGNDSSITIGGFTYIAKGGGGGGTRQANSVGRAGNDGGSGGGGSHSDSSTSVNVGGSSTKNTYNNWISLGNSGGDGKDGNDGGYGHGGGGGAGSSGENGKINGGGAGGRGINLSSIFGSSVGQAGWFGGGGGGTAFSGVIGATIGFANGGNGLFGGGGNGSIGAVNGINGLANTGGGGGGSDIYAIGGNGGSGVVIIKFKEIRNEGITAEENLIQATNNTITVNTDSKYVINYQNPINIPTGTYETIFTNGAITFKSKPDYNYPTTSKSPIIWYKFDGSQLLYDSSGNNNLINSGAVLDTNNFIRGNGSLSVSQNKVAKIGGANINLYSIQTTNGISFSVWFRATSASQYGRVFEFMNNAPPENYSVIMDFPNSPTTNNLRIYTFNTPTYINYTTSGINFCDGNWRHIVWTISSTGIWSFYINGVNQNINITGNIANSLDLNYSRVLGGSFDGSVSYMIGNIDDFRIFDYVLNSNEVYDLYNGNTDRSYPILKDVNNTTINPLVWYQFDISGNLGLDSMGIHNLTNPNGVAFSNDYIKGNGSASFDGVNDHLIKDSAFNLNSKNFSITLWIKKTDNARIDRLFQLGTGLAANTSMYLLYGNDNKIVFGNYAQDLVSASAYTDGGNWVHLCFTYLTGTKTAIIYRNGVNIAQMNFTNEFNTNNDIRIGSFSGSAFYKGLMDDFRIYESVLTATQVSELYNGRISIYNPPAFLTGFELEDEDLFKENTISSYK